MFLKLPSSLGMGAHGLSSANQMHLHFESETCDVKKQETHLVEEWWQFEER